MGASRRSRSSESCVSQDIRSVPDLSAKETQVTIPTVQLLSSTSIALNKIAHFVERLQEYGKHHLFDQDKVDFVRSLEKQVDSFSSNLPPDVLKPTRSSRCIKEAVD